MIVYENIVAYCKEHDISIWQFEKNCGLPKVVGQWKKGICKPSIRSLEKIAAATGIPMSRWLEKRAA